MKVYESMGLSRSGHHSMMNWIIKNLIGFQLGWDFKLTNATGTNFFHLNEANHDIPLSLQYINDVKEVAEVLFINYEDTPSNYTILNENRIFSGKFSIQTAREFNVQHENRIVFIRDFYNNLTSRIRANERNMFKKWNNDNPHLFEVGQIFIDRWKNHAKACLNNQVHYLKFEDWLENKDLRDKFLLECFGVKDRYGIENVNGTSSSFNTQENLNHRYLEVDIPQNIKDAIIKDSELHYLIGRLGYEYREL